MDDNLTRLRHSASHILAQAVIELFPGTKLAIGPAIEDGFYYDFDCPFTLNEETFAKIQEKMQQIIDRDLKFEREDISKDKAIDFFSKRGEPFKVELIRELEDTELVSFYRHDNFVDLCKGPHVNSTGDVKAFKLLKAAGAYWRGNEKNPMLQRIYGTAFENQKDLDDYLLRLEEAEKRDHRKLSKELDLFSIPEKCGPGLIVWHPKGAVIRNIIETFWKEEHQKRGYNLVYTPHIAKKELFETSGHYQFYKDFMFTLEVEGQKYALKPMNCPMHILIYKSNLHSYRELPIRFAEIGIVYRNEKSGVLHGGLRVRCITMDDAHIFCSREQMNEEIEGVVKLAQFFMSSFGFENIKVELSLMDRNNVEKYAGNLASWDIAENVLRDVLTKLNMEFEEIPGEAAFYGPKIDFKIIDSIGRNWQLSTIQFDFNLPERFDLTYVAPDGTEQRIFMIHRAILGGLERFISILLEHYGGSLPLWLSPEQVRILPIADRHHEYAEKVRNILSSSNVRANVDSRREKLNMKIRDAELKKIPYCFIIGDREAESDSVSIRKHKHGDIGSKPVDEILKLILKDIKERTIKEDHS